MVERLPPLIAVRYFEAAARHLSFTKAAQELHVTHSAISHQIKALEEWLGVPLFRRLNRSLMLTEAGQAYARPVRESLEKLGEASRALRAREQTGTLTVSVMPSFAAKFLVPRLGSFRRAHADIDVRISANERLVDFAREDVDVGVRSGRGSWPGLRVDRLIRENLFAVCSPKLLSGPIPLATPADLLQHTLMHDSDWPESMWPRWLAAAGVKAEKLNSALSFNNSSLMIQAAIDGLGIALTQEALVRDDLASGRLVRPFEIDMPSDYAYYVVTPEATAERPKVKAFREWLLAEVAASETPADEGAGQPREDVEAMSEHASALHREAIVWDTHGGFSPFADLDLTFLERWLAAGATYLSVNVGYDHVITWQDTIRAIAHFRRWIMLHPLKFMLAETPADIARAKHDGKLAIAFDLEGTDALDGNIEMIAFYYRLGVRQMLFAYNRTNRFAGGCHDDDIGLTPLGREALAEMNRIGMVVDCSHTSHRSTMEMMERSTAPVVFSHSNPRALCDHGRNIRDDQIRACAATGGVIGINGVGAFLGDNDISARRMVEHIDYVAQLVGALHVGLGLDYLPDVEEVPKLMKRYPQAWPGYSAADMMDNRFAPPELLPDITELLISKGYADSDVRGILGENFLRVARQVWK